MIGFCHCPAGQVHGMHSQSRAGILLLSMEANSWYVVTITGATILILFGRAVHSCALTST